MNKIAPKAPIKAKRKKRTRIIFWVFLLLLFSAITIISFTISYDYVIKKFNDTSKNEPVIVKEDEAVQFVIERGASTATIVRNLMEQGLIENETIFKLLSKINGYDGTYQSGTHIVSKSLNYDEMMRVLSNPPASTTVMIPEGRTFTQIVDILYEKKLIKDKKKFTEVANTGEFKYDFLKDIPSRDNRLEGYLFPDTYEFDLNVSEQQIIEKMLDNFDRKFRDEYRERIEGLGKDMNLDKVIIIASLIEREARDPDDRYLISGVLYNRLTSKDSSLRKLQIDATVQYVMLKETGAYKDRLLYKDLEVDDPYNTYLYEGLPPGPICCPGEAAIKAALNPDDQGYFYYVARGDAAGSHEFSKTFKQHQAAIKKYGAKE